MLVKSIGSWVLARTKCDKCLEKSMYVLKVCTWTGIFCFMLKALRFWPRKYPKSGIRNDTKKRFIQTERNWIIWIISGNGLVRNVTILGQTLWSDAGCLQWNYLHTRHSEDFLSRVAVIFLKGISDEYPVANKAEWQKGKQHARLTFWKSFMNTSFLEITWIASWSFASFVTLTKPFSIMKRIIHFLTSLLNSKRVIFAPFWCCIWRRFLYSSAAVKPDQYPSGT